MASWVLQPPTKHCLLSLDSLWRWRLHHQTGSTGWHILHHQQWQGSITHLIACSIRTSDSLWPSTRGTGECDPGGSSQSGVNTPERTHQGWLVWRESITGVRLCWGSDLPEGQTWISTFQNRCLTPSLRFQTSSILIFETWSFRFQIWAFSF